MEVTDPGLHATRHGVKYQPAAIPETKIVEAYGLQKCPKLVEQVAGDNIEVRVNALSVLCDEFNNPYSIFGCAQAGVIKVLASMVTDPDFTTRERASRALAIAATDANGLNAILDDCAVGDILCGRSDPSEIVRGNVYECLCHCTRTVPGIDACTEAGVTKVFVYAIGAETVLLKPTLLKALHNIVGSQQGLKDALAAGAVNACIELLTSAHIETRANAARTLGFMCYDETAKKQGLEFGAVPALVSLLADINQPTIIKANGTMALMAITSTDEGKRQMLSCDGANKTIALLYDDNRAVKLNALKVISNIAVYPPIRTQLLEDSTCIALLKRIKTCGDPLLERHAGVSLDAVNWVA